MKGGHQPWRRTTAQKLGEESQTQVFRSSIRGKSEIGRCRTVQLHMIQCPVAVGSNEDENKARQVPMGTESSVVSVPMGTESSVVSVWHGGDKYFSCNLK